MTNAEYKHLLSEEWNSEYPRERKGAREGPFADLIQAFERRKVSSGIYISTTPERIPRNWSEGRREYIWPTAFQLVREEGRGQNEQS